MKHPSSALYLLTALGALACAAMQPEHRLAVDLGVAVAVAPVVTPFHQEHP
jgi:hypothetical protein